MVALFLASTLSALPLLTLELAMPAAMVLTITFAPMMAETATPPEAATLTATDRMNDSFCAARSTEPAASTVEVSSI